MSATALLFPMLAAVALFQASTGRMTAGLIIVALAVVHDAVLGEATGLLYYGSAALADAVAIIFLSYLRPTCSAIYALSVLCFMSMVFNIVGFGMWYAYLPHQPYDFIMAVVYAAMISVLLWGPGNGQLGGSTIDRRRPGLRRPNYTGPLRRSEDKAKL